MSSHTVFKIKTDNPIDNQMDENDTIEYEGVYLDEQHVTPQHRELIIRHLMNPHEVPFIAFNETLKNDTNFIELLNEYNLTVQSESILFITNNEIQMSSDSFNELVAKLKATTQRHTVYVKQPVETKSFKEGLTQMFDRKRRW